MKSSTTETKHYAVIPLRDDQKPFMKAMTPSEQTEDAIYIPFDLLRFYKVTGTPHQTIALETLIHQHINTKNKIAIRPMQDDLGKGAFSIATILKGDFVAYPGLLQWADENTPFSEYSMKAYPDMDTEKNLQFNLSNTDTPARYFQHLVTGGQLRQGCTFTGTANFAPTITDMQLMLGKTLYIFPVILLTASVTIDAETLIGVDYGQDFWQRLGKPFTYLSSTGASLTSYWLECVNYRTKNLITVPINVGAYGLLVRENFVSLDHDHYILPAESIKRLDHINRAIRNRNGSHVIALPALLRLDSSFFHIQKNDIYIGMSLAKTESFVLPDNKVMKQFAVEMQITESSSHNGSRLVVLIIPLARLLSATTEMIQNLFNFLVRKNYVSEECFTLHIDPDMIAAMKKVTPKPKVISPFNFFTGTREKLSLPAPLVEHIIHLANVEPQEPALDTRQFSWK